MSLSSAINTAQSIFTNTGTQTAVVSKNIANAGNENYTRRDATVVGTIYGSQTVTIQRASDPTMMGKVLDSISQQSGQESLLSGLESMRSVLGGDDYSLSPSAYMSTLRDSLQSYATKPNEDALAQTVVTSAQDVANSLNSATDEIQGIRTQADKDIKTAVEKLRDLLNQFQEANDAVKNASTSGSSDVDALDTRDGLLKQISEIVGVKTLTRDNGDMVLYTTDGATLFESTPREISFQQTLAYDASTTGGAVYIDGVPVKAGEGGNTSAKGSLSALIQIRDEIAPEFQSQLDETARGLISMFSEVDQTGMTDNLPGLFTWDDGTVPSDGTLVPGIAARIKVNTALVTSQGGDPTLLRDGGINGSDFVVNSSGGTGYSDLLDGYVTAMDDDVSFDAAAGIDTSTDILSYASNSIGWLENLRSNADGAAENKAALYQRSQEAFSNKTGVSLDEELSLLLDLEQSYKASTKLLNTVDEMMKSLLEVAG
ncbi:flagellar hook-associated protein FlgK [Rhizobium sp. PAMB 3174]